MQMVLSVQAALNGLSHSEDLLMNGPSSETSPLCRAVTYDGHTVHVRICRWHSYGWHLEVIDASGNLTGWIEEFGTDEKALHEFYRTLLEEGIGDLVGDPSGFPCCGVQMSA